MKNKNFGVYEDCKMDVQIIKEMKMFMPKERWLNSDYLYELGTNNTDLYMSYEYFRFFESSIVYGWDDCRDHFISQNFTMTLWLKEWESLYLNLIKYGINMNDEV